MGCAKRDRPDCKVAYLLLSLVWHTSRSMWQKSMMCSRIVDVSQAMTHMRRQHLMQVSLLAGATLVNKCRAVDKSIN